MNLRAATAQDAAGVVALHKSANPYGDWYRDPVQRLGRVAYEDLSPLAVLARRGLDGPLPVPPPLPRIPTAWFPRARRGGTRTPRGRVRGLARRGAPSVRTVCRSRRRRIRIAAKRGRGAGPRHSGRGTRSQARLRGDRPVSGPLRGRPRRGGARVRAALGRAHVQGERRRRSEVRG